MYGSIGRDSRESINGSRSGDFWQNYTTPLPYDLSAPNKGSNYSRPGGAMDEGSWKFADGNGTAYWVGLTGEITAASPIRLAWDFNYGSVDWGKIKEWQQKRDDQGNALQDADGNNVYAWKSTNFDAKRQGFIINVLAEVKLDFATPGIAFWYGSGDTKDTYKIEEVKDSQQATFIDADKNGDVHYFKGSSKGSGRMPAIRPSSKMTSFGQDTFGNIIPAGVVGLGLSGTMGVMGQLKDLTFAPDLKHNLRVAYYQGTNHNSVVKNINNWNFSEDPNFKGTEDFLYVRGGGQSYMYLTDKDNALEFNLDTYYDIYKNLQLIVELGYIKLDLDEKVWGARMKEREQDMYKIAVGMRYTF